MPQNIKLHKEVDKWNNDTERVLDQTQPTPAIYQYKFHHVPKRVGVKELFFTICLNFFFFKKKLFQS